MEFSNSKYKATYTENIFVRIDYTHFMVQYEGVYKDSLKIQGIYLTVIDESYAILSVSSSNLSNYADINELAKLINNRENESDFYIVYIQPAELYTLQEISAIEASGAYLLDEQKNLGLTGEGVVVGIIDTGIDYLNEEFMDDEGNTRISFIWDQTIDIDVTKGRPVPFGGLYIRDDINKAIAAKRNGENPYDIVPSKDVIGHGTSMAGIVGARGKNPKIKGIAPDCEFAVIKLAQAVGFKARNGYGADRVMYGSPVIFSAIGILEEYLKSQKKPLVILLPLGTNSGNHKGEHMLDDYIQSITSNIGIAVVSGTGNEAIENGHVSGIMQNKGDEEVVDIIIAKEQKDFFMEVWVDLPNIAEVSLISPSGQSTDFIQVALNVEAGYAFTFEKTKAVIYYYIPERYSGDELIRIYFDNITPGIWRVALKLKLGEFATYNMWMMQKDLIHPGTRFSPSNPYGTVTIPGDSTFVITVAAYNQNNNNLLAYSGTAFKNDIDDKIDFAAGGVNTLTVGLNDTVRVINGTSLSAAIGAGACVLLFQWGIVNGNYPYMYTESIKTFLNRGTVKRKGDKYPNPHLGYGIINFYEIFDNMT
ncbi:Regulatory P domain of the subtilisin-like proprotein convertases and other proteases [uncultured Clostridium sp.]|uniref:S8 family peptidase n=1 Tax=uncultured Clostridium sp. TaxID=59620 RepID=UPI000821D77A|nr:S8 family peptidase [uncultured Clostridium sp.]SCK04741.1 Regulatory P domain of the subtilisin-like proprotein convertases and other proteases [uncultured Clostridium sp.]